MRDSIILKMRNMKVLFISLCLLPGFLCGHCDSHHACHYDDHLDHKRQLILETQIIQIKETLFNYQMYFDQKDFESILFNVRVIEELIY